MHYKYCVKAFLNNSVFSLLLKAQVVLESLICDGRLFHSLGAQAAKALSPYFEETRGSTKRF